MPSPDVRPYVDLTLFDASSQSIYTRALNYARSALPEFQPREGTLELILLQAMALECSEAIAAINRLPGATTEILLRLLDVQRSNGLPATTVVKLTGQTSTGFTVPLGTRLYYQASATSDPLLLETTAAGTGTHAKNIASISRTGSTVTVTTATRHGWSTGTTVSVTGTGVTALDAISAIAITVTDEYTFTLTSLTSGSASASTGTVTPASTVPATAFVSAQTTVLTGKYNGLDAGTPLQVLSVIPAIASAETATVLRGGASAETDSTYFERASSTLNRLSVALVTASQIEQYVIESGNFPEAYRVKVADNTNRGRVGNLASRVLIAAAPVDCSATNLLTGTGDGSVPSTSGSYGTLDEIYDGVNERVHSSLTISVSHPAIVTLQVTATAALTEGLTSTAAEDACVLAMEEYFSTNTWDWSNEVRVNDVVVALSGATVASGTSTYPATNHIHTVTLAPTDFYAPPESTYNRFEITNIARSGNVATVTVSASHGMSIGVNEQLYIKVAGTTNTSFVTDGAIVAASASGTTFTYSNTGTNLGTTADTSGYVIALVKRNTVTGNITILDPAPLLESAAHDITVT